MNINRRSFLASTAAMAGCLCSGCSSVNRIPYVGPSKIIDTHVHFYDPTRPQGVPWPPKNDALLYRTVLPGTYRQVAVPQRVDGVVVVEASPWVEDNQWLLDMADTDKLIVGLVGNLPIGTNEFDAYLKRFINNPLFRGVRTRSGTLEASMKEQTFVRDLTAIAEAGLSFDVHSPPSWVEQAELMARKVPGLRLIINHVANVSVTGGPPPVEWLDLMKKLSQHPQVFMKISGLVEGSKCNKGDAPVNMEFYQPVLDALWNIFGPDRLIYGSNWPVSARFARLATVQQIATSFLQGKGQNALDKVFYKNAFSAYGVALR